MFNVGSLPILIDSMLGSTDLALESASSSRGPAIIGMSVSTFNIKSVYACFKLSFPSVPCKSGDNESCAI